MPPKLKHRGWMHLISIAPCGANAGSLRCAPTYPRHWSVECAVWMRKERRGGDCRGGGFGIGVPEHQARMLSVAPAAQWGGLPTRPTGPQSGRGQARPTGSEGPGQETRRLRRLKLLPCGMNGEIATVVGRLPSPCLPARGGQALLRRVNLAMTRGVAFARKRTPTMPHGVLAALGMTMRRRRH